MSFLQLHNLLAQLVFIRDWVFGALVLVVLLIVIIAFRAWRSRQTKRDLPQPDLRIDLAALGVTSPPAGPYRLELYGTPVHLRALVIAPAGRHQVGLHDDDIPILLNQFMPGMLEIFRLHQPICRCWPNQLSSQGFAQSFFNHVSLPGNRGRGTPWTSVVGKFYAGEPAFLIGLACCTESPNSLSQFVIEHEGQWLDTLRIRQESS